VPYYVVLSTMSNLNSKIINNLSPNTYNHSRQLVLYITIRPHPDPVVENSSLAAVSPPKPSYDVMLPSDVIQGVKLSSLQLEAVIYACMRHETFLPDSGHRAGFFLGDG
jgi:hypothetical protein